LVPTLGTSDDFFYGPLADVADGKGCTDFSGWREMIGRGGDRRINVA
jgi:hypothetical protein